MMIKKRKGNLLEHLKLIRVKFPDNEQDAIDAKDGPKSQFYEINETVKKRKFSTQTTKTIEAFRQKCHTKLEDDDEEVQAITPEFTTALDEFSKVEVVVGCRTRSKYQGMGGIHSILGLTDSLGFTDTGSLSLEDLTATLSTITQTWEKLLFYSGGSRNALGLEKWQTISLAYPFHRSRPATFHTR